MPAIDLSSGRTFTSGFPHEFFAWLRRKHPVWWHEPTRHTPGGVGFWVVSRHPDAVTVMRDPVTFSSGHLGTSIVDTPAANVTLNQSDDPQHHRLRSLVNRGFTPTTIGRLGSDLRRRAERIVDAAPVGEPFDFVASVAQELPLQAICSILGVSQADRAALARIVNAGLEAETGEVLGSDQVRELGVYAQALIEEKRRRPGDDILSIVVHAGEDGSAEPLTDKELRAFFTLLFPAGAETTRGAIAGGVQALMEHPDQRDRLRSDPSVAKTAVEEIVRWTSPSAYKRRTATRDVELAGTMIRRGDKVTYWEMSANRDEGVFDEPNRFDVSRQPNPHVGFGLGSHFCLGASLARLELRIMLETLLERFEWFEPAGEPTRPPNNRLIGMTHLPLIARRRVGLAAARPKLQEATEGRSRAMAGDAQARGSEVYKKLGLLPAAGRPLPDHLRDVTMEHLFGDVWSRPGLELRDRSLITVTTLAALGPDAQLRAHLHGALNLGITPQQLEEVFVHLAHYAGWPVGVQASQALADVLSERESTL